MEKLANENCSAVRGFCIRTLCTCIHVLQFLQNNSSYSSVFLSRCLCFFRTIVSTYSSVLRLPLLDWDGHGGDVPRKIPPYRLLKKKRLMHRCIPVPSLATSSSWLIGVCLLSRRLLTARSPAMAATAMDILLATSSALRWRHQQRRLRWHCPCDVPLPIVHPQ